MKKIMKSSYRLYKRRRTGVYYLQNNHTKEQRSLHTSDKAAAERLLNAENEAREPAALNLELGRVYISNADPKMATRTWQEAINELCSHGTPVSQARYARELKSSAYDIIRSKPIIKTTSEDLRAVLKRGGSITNNFLRRLHNLAVDTRNVTRKQHSLRTKDEAEAIVLLNAKNKSFRQPVFNMQIARAYLTVSDPAKAVRTWLRSILYLSRCLNDRLPGPVLN